MQVHYLYVVPHFAEDMLIDVFDVLRRFQSHGGRRKRAIIGEARRRSTCRQINTR